MAGHSHAANVARRKAAVAAKKQKIFTKVARDIFIAARDKGKDPSMNPQLRLAIDKAKAVNMPKDKIENSILKGVGELPGTTYEEKSYEGYGPGGVAIIVDALTDNINRTSPEMKHLFSKNGGNMGEPGCVSWDFKQVGLIIIPDDQIDEEELMDLTIESGAEEFSHEENHYEIITSYDTFFQVLDSITNRQLVVELAEITKIPGNKIALPVEDALQVLKLIDLLESQQDSQNVYSNLEYTPDLLQALEKEN